MESRIYDLDALGLKFDEVFSQFIGVNGLLARADTEIGGRAEG